MEMPKYERTGRSETRAVETFSGHGVCFSLQLFGEWICGNTFPAGALPRGRTRRSTRTREDASAFLHHDHRGRRYRYLRCEVTPLRRWQQLPQGCRIHGRRSASAMLSGRALPSRRPRERWRNAPPSAASHGRRHPLDDSPAGCWCALCTCGTALRTPST